MSRTRKDAPPAKTVLEVIKRDDGMFDLFLIQKLDRNPVSEKLPLDALCVRYGFCGEEYDSILREADQNGRARVEF